MTSYQSIQGDSKRLLRIENFYGLLRLERLLITWRYRILGDKDVEDVGINIERTKADLRTTSPIKWLK